MATATRKKTPRKRIEATTYEKPAKSAPEAASTEEANNATETPAAAPKAKATRKATKRPTRNTGADRANSDAKPADGALTLADLADRYLKHMEAAGKSRGTVFSYSLDLGLAIKHFGEKTNVASLTPKKVQNFYDSDLVTKTRTGKGKAKPTILKARRVLRLALTWAAETGLITEASLPGTKPASK